MCSFVASYRLHNVRLHFSAFAAPQTPPPEQQKRYAALIKEQDSERMMDDGFFRSGAGNPESPAGFKS
jgi:hypothetical protein